MQKYNKTKHHNFEEIHFSAMLWCQMSVSFNMEGPYVTMPIKSISYLYLPNEVLPIAVSCQLDLDHKRHNSNQRKSTLTTKLEKDKYYERRNGKGLYNVLS